MKMQNERTGETGGTGRTERTGRTISTINKNMDIMMNLMEPKQSFEASFGKTPLVKAFPYIEPIEECCMPEISASYKFNDKYAYNCENQNSFRNANPISSFINKSKNNINNKKFDINNKNEKVNTNVYENKNEFENKNLMPKQLLNIESDTKNYLFSKTLFMEKTLDLITKKYTTLGKMLFNSSSFHYLNKTNNRKNNRKSQDVGIIENLGNAENKGNKGKFETCKMFENSEKLEEKNLLEKQSLNIMVRMKVYQIKNIRFHFINKLKNLENLENKEKRTNSKGDQKPSLFSQQIEREKENIKLFDKIFFIVNNKDDYLYEILLSLHFEKFIEGWIKKKFQEFYSTYKSREEKYLESNNQIKILLFSSVSEIISKNLQYDLLQSKEQKFYSFYDINKGYQILDIYNYSYKNANYDLLKIELNEFDEFYENDEFDKNEKFENVEEIEEFENREENNKFEKNKNNKKRFSKSRSKNRSKSKSKSRSRGRSKSRNRDESTDIFQNDEDSKKDSLANEGEIFHFNLYKSALAYPFFDICLAVSRIKYLINFMHLQNTEKLCNVIYSFKDINFEFNQDFISNSLKCITTPSNSPRNYYYNSSIEATNQAGININENQHNTNLNTLDKLDNFCNIGHSGNFKNFKNFANEQYMITPFSLQAQKSDFRKLSRTILQFFP